MVIHPGSSAKSFCQILSSYHHRDQAFSSSSSLPSQTKSIFVEQSPSHTELKQFLAEMNSPNFNRFDVGEGQLSSTFASTSSDNSNLSAEEEPVGGGGLEQVGNLPLSLLPSSSSAPSPSSSLLSPRMTCRESEERERATLKREEKKKEGDPLEEVDIFVVVVVVNLLKR